MVKTELLKRFMSAYIVFAVATAGFIGFLLYEGIVDDVFVEAATIRYVGGSGPGNYSKIQYAIDNASSGDTIYVWAGVYHENVVINKSVTLIGNGTINTTIDGGTGGDNVLITADWVNISGFTITNSSGSGIGLDSIQHCRIEYNNISSNNGTGIWLVNSTYNMIK